MRLRFCLALTGLLSLAIGPTAMAAGVQTFSPQGAVTKVEQVRATFGEPMHALGDISAAAPFDIDCPLAGAGHWVNDRTWVWDARPAELDGQACTFTLKDGIKTLANATLDGQRAYAFHLPRLSAAAKMRIARVEPNSRESISEHQIFLLHYQRKLAGLTPELYCEDSKGQRGPVRRLDTKEWQAIPAYAEADREMSEAVQCTAPALAGAALRLGMARPGLKDDIFDFHVREPLRARMSCSHLADANTCIAELPVTLTFNEVLPLDVLNAIRLLGPDGAQAGSARVSNYAWGEHSSSVLFQGPLRAGSSYTWRYPARVVDTDGRSAAPDSLPRAWNTAAALPVAFFGATTSLQRPLPSANLPVFLQNSSAPAVRELVVGNGPGADLANAQLIAWLDRLHASHGAFGGTAPYWTDAHLHSALLNGVAGVLPRAVPASAPGMELSSYPLPLTGYGLHVLEMPSTTAVLAAPSTFERSAVLLTNMAVQLKLTTENAAVWVTALDSGKPVAGADVSIVNCAGVALWQGRTNADGIAQTDQALVRRGCADDFRNTVTAIARRPDANGAIDVSLTASDAGAMIDARTQNVGQRRRDERPQYRADTIVDRRLLRPGETVHMRHVLRRESMAGLDFVADDKLPDQLVIQYGDDGKEWILPLQWDAQHEAVSQFTIPDGARLGDYGIAMRRTQDKNHWSDIGSGEFAVAAFRLPQMEGAVTAAPAGLIGGQAAGLRVDLHFANGGAAKQWPVQARVTLRKQYSDWPGMRGYNFSQSRDADPFDAQFKEQEELLFHTQTVMLDDKGNGLLAGMPPLPVATHPYSVRVEASYADPNGAQQTLTQRFTVWPGAVRLGIAKIGQPGIARPMMLSLMALDLQGVPVAGQKIDVTAARTRLDAPYRGVNDPKEPEQALGTICSATTNARGVFSCLYVPAEPGRYYFTARATDPRGRMSTTTQATDVREDVVANKELFIEADRAQYEAGQTAHLRVRTPFASAQAWLTVEREGIIASRVVTLAGPVADVAVPIDGAWAPNVFVSLLALAPPASGQAADSLPEAAGGVVMLRVANDAKRLRVTLKTAHTDYRPRQHASVNVHVTMPDGKAVPPRARVSFVAVDEALLALMPNTSWQLLETMLLERFYATSTTSQLTVREPHTPGQQHAATLRRLIDAINRETEDKPRSKAPAPISASAGEPGMPIGIVPSLQRVEVTGSSISPSDTVAPEFAASAKPGLPPVRGLLDTLLLWKADVPLDAAGNATLDVPLNDALTRFHLVAIASVGANHFGSGNMAINVTQDVQLTSGLPQVVREGDRMMAMLTVRNSGKRPLRLRVNASADGVSGLAPQTVAIGAGGARVVQWNVAIPVDRKQLTWRFAALDLSRRANGDRLEVKQAIEPAVPVTVQAATLEQVDGKLDLALAPVAQALDGKSSIQVHLQASLAGGMPGVRDWLERYPYHCLEQKWSVALGRKDRQAWQAVVDDLPKYMDEDGLANYFPRTAKSDRDGSDTLTGYLLNTAQESGWPLPAEAQNAMLNGLAQFVSGRIVRHSWAPREDGLARKLAALATLSRYKQASAQQLAALRIDPDEWTSAMLIDWLTALRHIDGVADGKQLQAQAENALRARLSFQGRRMVLSNEERDHWWWLMQSGDVDSARLLLAVQDLPSWRDDLPRLLGGMLGRQKAGAWDSTTGNLWGTLAVDRFAAQMEKTAVDGHTTLALGDARRSVDWAAAPPANVAMPVPSGSSALQVVHTGAGRPWVTVEALAAVPLTAPLQAGYNITRKLTPVQQKVAGSMSVGDIWRVTVSVDAQADMTWVVVNDPVPAGASILGTGLGGDLASATQGEKASGHAWETFRERDVTSLRSYYGYVPRGQFSLDYTIRLNNAGTFLLPPTRVEAMYAPDVFGALPNAPVTVLE